MIWKNDPAEMYNIYGRPGTEEVTAELKTTLLDLQQQYNDPVRFGPERDKEWFMFYLKITILFYEILYNAIIHAAGCFPLGCQAD